jgi:hypothetical protein
LKRSTSPKVIVESLRSRPKERDEVRAEDRSIVVEASLPRLGLEPCGRALGSAENRSELASVGRNLGGHAFERDP